MRSISHSARMITSLSVLHHHVAHDVPDALGAVGQADESGDHGLLVVFARNPDVAVELLFGRHRTSLRSLERLLPDATHARGRGLSREIEDRCRDHNALGKRTSCATGREGSHFQFISTISTSLRRTNQKRTAQRARSAPNQLNHSRSHDRQKASIRTMWSGRALFENEQLKCQPVGERDAHLDLLPNVLFDLLQLLCLHEIVVHEKVLDQFNGIARRTHRRNLVAVAVRGPGVGHGVPVVPIPPTTAFHSRNVGRTFEKACGTLISDNSTDACHNLPRLETLQAGGNSARANIIRNYAIYHLFSANVFRPTNSFWGRPLPDDPVNRRARWRTTRNNHSRPYSSPVGVYLDVNRAVALSAPLFAEGKALRPISNNVAGRVKCSSAAAPSKRPPE